MSATRVPTAAVLVAWSLLAVGDCLREGELTPASLACVSVGFLIVLAVAAWGHALVPADQRLLAVPVLTCVVAAVAHPAVRYMFMTTGGRHASEVLSVMAAVAVGLSLIAGERWQRLGWFFVMAATAMTGYVVVSTAPDPTIDVWWLLQQSSSGLFHGENLYRQYWAHSTGLQMVYPYLPITTVIVAPFHAVFGDVRYGLAVASLLGAFLVRRIAPEVPFALAALILIVPHWAFLIDQSWTEPILIAALAGTFLALRADRPGVAVLTLALALACKQHIVLLLPLFAIWPQFGWRRTLAAAGVALALVLPWIIAGPGAIWHDAVHANLSLPVQTRSLSLPGLFSRHDVTVGFWFLLLFLAVAYALAALRLPRSLSGLGLGCALVLWALDLANKESYFNHYMLTLGMIVIAVAAADQEGQAAPSPALRRGRTGASRPVPARSVSGLREPSSW
jgi:hypothetical protein